MKLRTQALLGVVPLFLLIGLAGATASLLLKSFDWRQGVEGQARGMAISIAEYLAGDQWPIDNPAAQQRLLAAEEKLERWEFIRGIWIWDTQGNLVHQWPNRSKEEDRGETLVPLLDPTRATAANAFAVGHMQIGFEPSEAVRGGAVVWGEGGTRLGWIECELEASGWLEAIGWLDERNNQKTGVLELMVVIMLLGGLIAWFFARLVRGDIQRLINSAQKVGGGDYVPPAGMHVKELQDLSETFSVLDSLTSENRRKFQRSLIENEIFRTSGVLVEELQNAAMPDLDEIIAGSRVVSRLFDQTEGARWHGVGGDTRRGWLWFGVISGPNGIKKAAQALAVTAEFESLLIQHEVSPESALAELGPLYHLHRAYIVTWTVDRAGRDIWTWSQDSSANACQIANQERRFLGCDLEGEMATTIDLVWQGSRSRDLDTALAELKQFLGKTSAVIAAIETID